MAGHDHVPRRRVGAAVHFCSGARPGGAGVLSGPASAGRRALRRGTCSSRFPVKSLGSSARPRESSGSPPCTSTLACDGCGLTPDPSCGAVAVASVPVADPTPAPTGRRASACRPRDCGHRLRAHRRSTRAEVTQTPWPRHGVETRTGSAERAACRVTGLRATAPGDRPVSGCAVHTCGRRGQLGHPARRAVVGALSARWPLPPA